MTTNITKQLAEALSSARCCVQDGTAVAKRIDAALSAYAALASAPAQPVDLTDAEIDTLIDEIEQVATDYDMYEYKLPSADGPRSQMRDSVRTFVAAHAAPADRSLSEDGWMPVETAPADELVAVFWIDQEGTTHHDLDYIEDECWSRWHDHAEHTEIIGGHGVSYTPPYTHWKRLGTPSTTAALASTTQQEDSQS